MTSQPKMDTPSEPVALWAERLRNLIAAARADGCLIGWDFTYVEWFGEQEVSTVDVSLYRNRRDANGVMRTEARALFLEAYI